MRRNRKFLYCYPDKIRITPCEGDLADADSESCPDRPELSDVAIGRECEVYAIEARYLPSHAANCGRLTVEADQAVAAQILQPPRRPIPFETAAMGMEADGDFADPPQHQRVLRGFDHSNGNIGIPSQQIFDLIGKNERDFQLWVFRAERSEDGGKTSTPITSLALTRTVPLSVAPWADAARSKAAAVDAACAVSPTTPRPACRAHLVQPRISSAMRE